MNHDGPRYAAGRGHSNNRGRYPRSAHNSTYPPPQAAGGEEPFVAGSSNPSTGAFRGRGSPQISQRNPRKQFVQKQASSSEQQWRPRPVNSKKDASPSDVDLLHEHNSADGMSDTSKQLLGSIASNSDSLRTINTSEPILGSIASNSDSIRTINTSEQILGSIASNSDSIRTSNTSEQILGSIASSSDCNEILPSSAQNVSNSLHSAVERIQILEPTAKGESCSDSLPYDSCNRSDAVQVSLESFTKEGSSTIKLREIQVPDYKDSEDKKPSLSLEPFDICPPKSGVVMLKPSLLDKNRETRNEMKRAMEGNGGNVLRPGMVLLKNCIPLRDQVKIVKKCRDLGIGDGGFYQPGYREGGKLHLKMMCLGKNWDPDRRQYGAVRPFDDKKPPGIPNDFYQLVEKAIKDSYAIMGKDSTTKNPECVLPWMNPSICIVNFYSENGRLGLHQDRDESRESLDKGLPVVSFSIGDSADFLFGDKSDTDQAEKVILESGDILIFGGKSRLVFHGVTTIHPKTAPRTLLDQTNLRPGRLNLTFRQD